MIQYKRFIVCLKTNRYSALSTTLSQKHKKYGTVSIAEPLQNWQHAQAP